MAHWFNCSVACGIFVPHQGLNLHSLHYAAAAAAKSLQSRPTLQPHRRQPTRPRHPWDSPGKNTGVGCHFLLQCMKVKSESEVAQSCQLLATPWAAAHQAPPSMGFSRQEYWSGVPLPSPPLDCKEIQPVHPKEISPEYSLEGLMLKLKLQYFGHLM